MSKARITNQDTLTGQLKNALLNGDLGTAQFLKNNGAEIDVYGFLDAHWAAINIPVLKFLIDGGLDLNSQSTSTKGVSWFMSIAFRIGQNPGEEGFKVLEAIVQEKWADINHQEKEGNTVLMSAVNFGLIALCEFLINCEGIELNIKNTDGDSALTNACESGNYDIAVLLLERGANPRVLPALDTLRILEAECMAVLNNADSGMPPFALLWEHRDIAGDDKLRDKTKAVYGALEERYKLLPGLYFMEKVLDNIEALKKCLAMPNFAILLEDARKCPVLVGVGKKIEGIFNDYEFVEDESILAVATDPVSVPADVELQGQQNDISDEV